MNPIDLLKNIQNFQGELAKDLIKAAIHDARTKLQEAIKNELGPLLGGLAGQGTDISGLINLLGVQ